MVIENVTNFVFTNMCNSKLNPTRLSNEESTFSSILFHQHIIIMFCNIDQLNCIISSKTMSTLKKMSHGHVAILQTLCSILRYIHLTI